MLNLTCSVRYCKNISCSAVVSMAINAVHLLAKTVS